MRTERDIDEQIERKLAELDASWTTAAYREYLVGFRQAWNGSLKNQPSTTTKSHDAFR